MLVVRVRACAVPTLRVSVIHRLSVLLATRAVHRSHARRVVELVLRPSLGHARVAVVLLRGRCRVRVGAQPAGRLHVGMLLARIRLLSRMGLSRVW